MSAIDTNKVRHSSISIFIKLYCLKCHLNVKAGLRFIQKAKCECDVLVNDDSCVKGCCLITEKRAVAAPVKGSLHILPAV